MSSYSEIGSLLVQIHQFFVSIGYIEHDQVCWPPHSEEMFSVDECRENGMSENAVALVRHLPRPKSIKDSESKELFRKARAVGYGNEDDIEGSRHPIMGEYSSPEDDTYERLPDNMLTLAYGEFDETSNIILDADGC